MRPQQPSEAFFLRRGSRCLYVSMAIEVGPNESVTEVSLCTPPAPLKSLISAESSCFENTVGNSIPSYAGAILFYANCMSPSRYAISILYHLFPVLRCRAFYLSPYVIMMSR